MGAMSIGIVLGAAAAVAGFGFALVLLIGMLAVFRLKRSA